MLDNVALTLAVNTQSVVRFLLVFLSVRLCPRCPESCCAVHASGRGIFCCSLQVFHVPVPLKTLSDFFTRASVSCVRFLKS